MRSAFISYGNKLALDGRYGVTREIIQRVAEDKESWGRYSMRASISNCGEFEMLEGCNSQAHFMVESSSGWMRSFPEVVHVNFSDLSGQGRRELLTR